MCRLGLKGNLLRELPASIGGMTSLVELFITDNRLESLPAAMGKLTSLVKLQACAGALVPAWLAAPRLAGLPLAWLFSPIQQKCHGDMGCPHAM